MRGFNQSLVSGGRSGIDVPKKSAEVVVFQTHFPPYPKETILEGEMTMKSTTSVSRRASFCQDCLRSSGIRWQGCSNSGEDSDALGINTGRLFMSLNDGNGIFLQGDDLGITG